MDNDRTKKHNFDDYVVASNNVNDEYCNCDEANPIFTDVESCDFGYWDRCGVCGKKIEDGFHYYQHYDGVDHDDCNFYD